MALVVRNKMALTGVTVAIEAVDENQIQEVTLDGQEILVPYVLCLYIFHETKY